MTKPGLLKSLLAQARLAARLLREPAVPLVTKAVPLVAAFYLIWPIDLLPDLFPILGQLDDLGVVVAALELFLHLSPDAPASYHRAALAANRPYTPMPAEGKVIDGDFRVDS
jgi:uncharacterized membrane protein YkvA (DUF1232 family)